jgi:broad specificity phosphatase PhoE
VTRLLLVRHAESEGLGRRLWGRLPGSPLTGTGRRQAAALAARLSSLSLDAVVSSPLERAMDTATAMAARGRREVAVDDAFTEVDFGTWAGAAFSELVGQAEWDRWNSERSRARCPGGESMAEVQDRAAAGVERWTRTPM